MVVLGLGGTAGLILGMWARSKEGFFVAIGCWVGAALLIALAEWAYIVGLLILAIAIFMIVVVAVRWKKVADSAIGYADDLKKRINPADKEEVNIIADRVQSPAIKKYILEKRKLGK